MKRGILLLVVATALVIGAVLYSRPTITRGPYLQQSSPTSIVIRWRTRWPVKSVVRYGPAPGQLKWQKANEMRGTDHAVLLSGLRPGTQYYYQVVASRWIPGGDRRVRQFVTAPANGSTAPVRIWVLGDSGTHTSTQRAVRDAFYRFSANRPADLCLMLGDNAYREGNDVDYQEGLFDFYSELLERTPVWPTAGNHDARSADTDTASGVYFDIFNLPSRGESGGVMSGTEAYYAFDYGNIHFISLDSEGSGFATNAAMATWLKRDLRANHRLWTIVFAHRPPYTMGTHNSDIEQRMSDLREHIIPILEEGGVDLVLGGHSHNYERSYLLDGHYGTSGTFSETMIKARRGGAPDRTGPYVKPGGAAPHQGTIYVVAGSSGQTGRLKPQPHPAMCVALDAAGSVVLDVSGPELKAVFIDEQGRVRDRFVLRKETRIAAYQSGDPLTHGLPATDD